MKPLSLYGHPLHPVTVHATIGLLSAVPLFDAVGVFGGPNVTVPVLTAGLFFALPTVATGFMDLARIPQDSTEGRTVDRHMVFAMGALLLFALSLSLRWIDKDTAGMTTSAFGTVLIGITGWFGGELVYRFGVGVDEGKRPTERRDEPPR